MKKYEFLETNPDMELEERERVINHNLQVKNKEMERIRKKLLKQKVAPPMTKEERFELWKKKNKNEYKKLISPSRAEILRKKIIKKKIEKQKLLVDEMIQMRNSGMTVREIAYTLKFTRQHISFILKKNKKLINMENVKENRYLKSMTFSKREIEMIEEIKGETGLTNVSAVIHIALTEYYRSIFPAYLKKK